MQLQMKLKTYWRLGPLNAIRVLMYRLGLQTGLHPVVRIQDNISGNKFFTLPPLQKNEEKFNATPSPAWQEKGLFFGWKDIPIDEGRPPDWHKNYFSNHRIDNTTTPWWKISDFNSDIGDIKTVWEASRFDWVLPMAQRAKSGNVAELDRLNDWLSDWCDHNPAYLGTNWKCGQEASIRVIHLAVGAYILDQISSAQPDLLQLVRSHLRRIYPTVSYAIAQDNNHGTSEAAALFIGGHWCQMHGLKEGNKWARTGRRLLENRVKRLIEADGSFSQYSVNYHRLMLDTLCITELWRRWLQLDVFSTTFYARAKAATHWLFSIVNAETGDVPNVGANDGARLLPLVNSDYRDFRPTVQLAMALFENKRAYPQPGLHNTHLQWLGVMLPTSNTQKKPRSHSRENGGYSILRKGKWMALFRYPVYRFRPSHCDALHIDLWHGTENVLRDGGSYSYNTEPSLQQYFTGTKSHNTIEFDNRDQMPRISRFLRGEWLQARDVKAAEEYGNQVEARAAYRDWQNAMHRRHIKLDEHGLTTQDDVSGFSHCAVLRWRLLPGHWSVRHIEQHNTKYVIVTNGEYTLEIHSNVPIVRCEIVNGWESRYYMHKSILPVVEVEIQLPGRITTHLTYREG